MDFQARLEALAKNKKIVIPAVLIGGAAGIYVLATKGQGGGTANVAPGASDQPQPSQDNGGGSGGDTAGLLQQLADAQQQNQSMFSQLQSAFQQGLQSLSDALGQSNAANQSALQSLADQTNKALAGVQTSGFNGFDSQFGTLLSQLPQYSPQANTGIVQQSMLPSITNFKGNPLNVQVQKVAMALSTAKPTTTRYALPNLQQILNIKRNLPVFNLTPRTYVQPQSTLNNLINHVNTRYPSNPIVRPSTQPIAQKVIGTINTQYGRGH